EVTNTEVISKNILSLKDMLFEIEKLVRRFKTSVIPVDKVSEKRLKIVFLSPLDHEFWYGVRQGAMYAKKELAEKNVDVEYYGFTEKTWENTIDTFQKVLEEGADGIILPGF